MSGGRRGDGYGNQGPRDGVGDSVIVILAFTALIGFIWWRAHDAIAGFVMQVRLLEARLISGAAADAIAHWVASTAPSDVTLGELWRSGEVLGQTWLGWLSAGLLAVIGAIVLYRLPDRPGHNAKTYTMASLARQESKLWPAIRPVLDQNLVNVSLDDPIQGMRQTPRVYGRRYQFVVPANSLKRLPPEAEPISAREVLLVGRARKVFRKQLGRRWKGVDALKPHEKALFAAFAAQACYASEAAQALINELPCAYMKAVKAKDAGKITSHEVDALLTAHGESAVVKKILARHTYVRTVLMGLLEAARNNGILPPCWFRWLKTVDRITWYALADMGTDNASAEAAGVRAHYNAERLIRGEIDEPEVEAAIDGTRDYLQEILDEDPDND